MINPYLGMALIALMLGGLMFGLRMVQTRFELHPEVVRKLMHVIMGLVTLNLPWIFSEKWPVVTLAVVTVVALFTLKRSKLKDNVGQVLHGVNRASHGDLAFPLAVATVFVLADGNAILYCVPILILTIADATAALIGIYYGTFTYQAAEGKKSLEGSLAFFAVTFNSVLLTLLIFTQVDRIESILIAFLLGLLVMMLEAIAWQGLDNLFVPLASFLLLNSYFAMDLRHLIINLVFILALLLIILLLRQSSGFDVTAVMTSAVMGYLIWAAGGWLWLLPPMTLFLSYRFVMPNKLIPIYTEDDAEKPAFIRSVILDSAFNLYTILSATTAGLIWLLFANALSQPKLIFPYMLSFAVYLSLIGLGRMNYEAKRSEQAFTFWHSIGFAGLVISLPFLLITQLGLGLPMSIISVVISLILACWIFYYIEPIIRKNTNNSERWRWQGGLAGVCSLLGLVPLLL